MTGFLQALHTSYPNLSLATAYTTALFVISAAALPFDGRLVAGVNPWIKPIKFEVSIIIYALTIGWLLLQLPGEMRPKRWIAAGVASAMTLEITAIVVQAARGVKSHYNIDSPADAAVFALMGVMIALNTVLAAWLLLLYWRADPPLPLAMVWGIRLGLIAFLLASVEGFVLVRNLAHTVGAPDGGPGLPFLNWSTTHGDLRIAHFVGMHGLQALPLLGWWLSREDRQAGTRVVVLAFAVLVAAFAWTLQQALAAQPLLRL
jgi:hypothetical protein